MKNLIKSKKAQLAGALIGVVIALVVGTIMLSIVGVLTNGTTVNLGGGLADTVVSYIAVGLAITLLVIAFGAASGRSS